MSRYRDFLKQVDFLVDLSDSALDRIGSDVKLIEVLRGDEIFADGTVGDRMYFILDGVVSLKKAGLPFLKRSRNEYVGEMALIDDLPRSAAAVAETDVRLLVWSRDAFLACVLADSRIALSISRSLNAKVREASDILAQTNLDLDRAAQIQQAMLPDSEFENDTVDLVAYYKGADAVGGDYYDYVIFEDGKIALFIADVEGHGFSAALLVAMLKTSLYSQVLRDPSPEQVLAALNTTILEYVAGTQLVTCFYVLLNLEEGTYRYCGAGHVPQYAYSRSSGRFELLESQNPILGFFEMTAERLGVTEGNWRSGDSFVLHTDGVIEMENSDEVEFGRSRLERFLQENRHEPPGVARDNLHQELASFRGSQGPVDDVTFVLAQLR